MPACNIQELVNIVVALAHLQFAPESFLHSWSRAVHAQQHATSLAHVATILHALEELRLLPRFLGPAHLGLADMCLEDSRTLLFFDRSVSLSGDDTPSLTGRPSSAAERLLSTQGYLVNEHSRLSHLLQEHQLRVVRLDLQQLGGQLGLDEEDIRALQQRN